jgi:murein L,D-transpeptidase YafK
MFQPKKNTYMDRGPNHRKRFLLGVIIGILLFSVAVWSHRLVSMEESQADNLSPAVEVATLTSGAVPEIPAEDDDRLLDGPVLWYDGSGDPLHLILVEKDRQQLHLYRFDGRYKLLKTYDCATGEREGRKRQENDERTPEGIYFNNKTFRDKKITLFGDRAFGLNYPDPLDNIEGNRGSGIFIHGSNREIKPRSSNGCIVLNGEDIASLDSFIEPGRTPIIIGDRLPYRFQKPKRNVEELIPFFKQVMLPEKHAHLKAKFDYLAVIGFRDRVVATGRFRLTEAKGIKGVATLYLAEPTSNYLVLVSREWKPDHPIAVGAAEAPEADATTSEIQERERIASTLESWRRAWEQKRIEAYIGHYHPSFNGNGKDIDAWRAYKDMLNKRYRRISVTIADLVITVRGSTAKAYFRQRYESDTFRSSGYKIIEFRKDGQDWKIFRENSYARKPRNWPA